MNSDIKTFVLLKYNITYDEVKLKSMIFSCPIEALTKTAWRIAKDVEYLANDAKSKHCIKVAKLHGLTKNHLHELQMARRDTDEDDCSVEGYWAATTAYDAALLDIDSESFFTNVLSSAEVSNSYGNRNIVEKHIEYINWLIEELCIYESNQNE